MAGLSSDAQRPQPAPTPSAWPLRLGVLLLTLGMFGCDHATKLAAEAKLAHAPAVPVVAGLLELRYAPNDDTAFSLLRTLGVARSPAVLLTAAGIALVAVLAMWIASRKRATTVQHVAFGLVVAGALGNVVDRAARGYVVDFIHVTRWPVFNVADIAVVVGMILLALGSARNRDRPSSTDPASS